MKKVWTMTPEHAAHRAATDPTGTGYPCGAFAETFGGGCYNCGWKPAPKRAFVVALQHDRNGKPRNRRFATIEAATAFANDFARRNNVFLSVVATSERAS